MRKHLLIVVVLALVVITGLLILDGEMPNRARREFVRAAHEGKIWKMRLLMLAGVDVNTYAPGMGYALPSAAGDGQYETVVFLLDHGADINATQKFGWTALTSAAWDGHMDVLRLLLDKCAQVNVVSDEGSALHVAIKKGYAEIAELLRRHGAKDCYEYEFDKCA